MRITELLDVPCWSEALNVKERYEQVVHAPDSVEQPQDAVRLQQWIEKFFGDRGLLEQRIVADGMDPDCFYAIIDAPDTIYDCSQAAWFQELVQIFTAQEQYDLDSYLYVNKEEIPFFEFMRPFLQRTIRILEQGLDDVEWIGKGKVIGIVLKIVMDKMFHLSVKTLIYELNKSRLHQELQGETPNQRYKSFTQVKTGSYEDILTLLGEYPVLARMLCESLIRIHSNMLTVIQRLIHDKREIEQAFQVRLDKLIDIHFLGDIHNGGACVLRLEFSNQVNLIYKPRDLSVDRGFAHLLAWLNDKGIHKPFSIMRVLNKGEYGWQEYIAYEACIDDSGVESYFERQGQYLALLYATNATDMHMENVIAHGEHPFLIDLESLFHHQAFVRMEEKPGYSAFEKTAVILNDSVLKTNMLPTLDSNFLYHSDLSGLAGDTVQTLSTYELIDKNTDTMKIRRSKIEVEKHTHLPSFNNQSITPRNYMDLVKRGFYQCYRLISSHKQELGTFIDKWFHGCVVRTIIRPTITYFTLLEASNHPKYLKSGVDKDLLLDHLWAVLKQDPNRAQAIRCECSDLSSGDIPMFSTGIGDISLYHHQCNEAIIHAYSTDIITTTLKKIERMNEDDANLQWEFIERTVQTKYLLQDTYTMEKSKLSVTWEQIEPYMDSDVDKQAFLEEAIRIGDYIKDIAVFGDDGQTVSWISMGMDADEQLIYKSSELGLYNGVTGIAYFYIYLAQASGNGEYDRLADLCINTALEMIERNVDKNVSVFTGYGSLLYLLLHKAVLTGEAVLVDKAIRLLDILEQLIDTDEHLDLIAGCAGTLMTCIDFYHAFHTPKALDVAIKCGHRLLDKSQQMETGISWVTSSIHPIPLTGLAHGSAGICLSLMKLYEATGDLKYYEASMEGIRYENCLYLPQENNWLDLRISQGELPEGHHVMYWCNGAPGIGLARIGMSRLRKSDVLAADINRALDKTMKDGFTEVSYSLCHGDMGNLELIMLAADDSQDARLEKFVKGMSHYILAQVRENQMHWKCGIPGRQQIPGLMLGLAGIGYQLLRLHNRQLPSVLLLEGPGRTSRLQQPPCPSLEYNNA